MFVLPWNGNTIVGTTDVEKFSGTKDNPQASKEEIDYLIRHVKKYFDIETLEYIEGFDIKIFFDMSYQIINLFF